MSDLKNVLIKPIDTEVPSEDGLIRKITIIGVGQVGMAGAFSILTQGICEKLVLIDVVKDRVEGEVMDMQHCQQFLNRCTVTGSTEYEESKGSDIVVVTAGARQREGEPRLNLVQRNVDIFKGIIPKIVENSPNCVLVIVSNPVDLMTSIALKLSGLPKHQVIGTGTMLDSARFRYLIAEKLNINPQSVHGDIIGEHGDSSVAVWSKLNVGGTRLRHINPKIGHATEDPENWEEIHKSVINSAYQMIKLKGYTSWAIGTSIASLSRSILSNERCVLPLSVPACGMYGIEEDIHLSVPVVVSRHGYSHVVLQELTKTEVEALQKSAKTLADTLRGIKW